MNQKMLMTAIWGIVAALIFIALTVESGVLPWAILCGAVMVVGWYYFRRDIREAIAAGIVSIVAISVLGIGVMLPLT